MTTTQEKIESLEEEIAFLREVDAAQKLLDQATLVNSPSLRDTALSLFEGLRVKNPKPSALVVEQMEKVRQADEDFKASQTAERAQAREDAAEEEKRQKALDKAAADHAKAQEADREKRLKADQAKRARRAK